MFGFIFWNFIGLLSVYKIGSFGELLTSSSEGHMKCVCLINQLWLQSVTEIMEKTAIWTILCFSPLLPLNYVEEQWARLTPSNVIGSQHCIGREREF